MSATDVDRAAVSEAADDDFAAALVVRAAADFQSAAEEDVQFHKDDLLLVTGEVRLFVAVTVGNPLDPLYTNRAMICTVDIILHIFIIL